MNIPSQLKEFGLKQSEIRIYLYLLEQGVSTPPQIAAGTLIARPNCYLVLQTLEDKGLIAEQTKGKRKVYYATDPSALLQNLEQRKKTMAELLPDLEALRARQINKPVIRFFDGFEQVKQIYWETLSAKEILAIASTQKLKSISNDFFNKYRQEVQNHDIDFKDIITYDSLADTGKSSKELLKGLYEYKVLPKKITDLPTDILIWNDNIALITLNEPVFGTVLSNPPLARTFRIIFDLCWEKLSE